MASTYVENLESGTLGAELTTGNTTFDNIQQNGLGTVPYFGSVASMGVAAHQGTYMAVVDTTLAADNATMGANFTLGGTHYTRFYLYIAAAPSVTTIIGHTRSGVTTRAQLRLTDTRMIQMRNGTSAVYTSTTAIPLNTWVRVEWKMVNGTGQHVKVYSGANVDSPSTTLIDSAIQTFNTGTMDSILFGVMTSCTVGLWFDGVAGDNADWVGPIAGASGSTATPARISATAAVPGVQSLAAAVSIRNSFEVGPDEAIITAANSAGGGTAFSAVTLGTSASAAYDVGRSAHGTYAGRFATGATAGSSYVQWDTAQMGDTGEGWWRFYVQFENIPTAARYLAEWRSSTGVGATCAKLQILTTGILVLEDTSVEIFRSTYPLIADKWYRIEIHLDFSTTVGQADMWIYAAPAVDDTVAVDTQSSAANRNMGAATCNRVRFGHLSSAINQTSVWLDEIAYSSGAKLGPFTTDITALASGTAIAARASIPTPNLSIAGVGIIAPQPIYVGASTFLPDSVGATGGGSAIQWGSSANYAPTEGAGMTVSASFSRFRSEMSPVALDYFHSYTTPAQGGIPLTVNESIALSIAKAQGGLDVELNIKTDWVSNGATGPWLTRLTTIMNAIKAEGPAWTPIVRFVLNHESDNSTADPNVNRPLAEAQAGYWREHTVAMARHIWARNDPQFMAEFVLMGFTSRLRLDGSRVAKWLAPNPHWNPAFTADEKANKIIVGGDIYPILDANGDHTTGPVEDGRMAAFCKLFDDYYAMGYRRFAFSEVAYNTEKCTNTQEVKVRDAIRGYTSTGAVVPGSMGEWLRTTPYNIMYFGWYESSLDTVYHTLHVSPTRMQGYKDLITGFRAGGSAPKPPITATAKPLPLVARAAVPAPSPQTGGAQQIRPATVAALAGVGAVAVIAAGVARPTPAILAVVAAITGRIPSGGAFPATLPPLPPAGPIPPPLTTSSRWDNVIRGSQVLELRVDAYRYSDAVNRLVLLASDLPIEPSTATITVDGESEARRTCELVIADPTLVPIGAADILTPHGTELHIRRGFRYPDGVIELVPVGVFRIDKPSTPMLGAISVTGVDRSRLIAEDKFLHATQSVTGNTVVAEITRLIYNSYPGGAVEVINRTTDTTICRRTTWEADSSPWAAINELALSIDADVGVDAAGRFVIRPMPQLTDSPAWTVDIGQTGVLVAGTEEWDRERVFNAVVARSEPTDGSNPLQYTAYDLNPASPTYWHGTFGHRPRSYSSPLLQSVGACAAAANTILRQTTAPARTLRVQCIPNPSLDFGDVVTVVLPPLTESDNARIEQHMVWSYTMPLGLGVMDLNLFSSNPGGE